MIMDKLSRFCDADSVAQATGIDLVGDVMDLGAVAPGNIGGGKTAYLVLTCTTSIITGGAAGTILFQLVSDAAAAIAADGTETIHWQSKAFVTDDVALAEILAGSIIAVVPLPYEGDLVAYERYLGIQTVIATTTVTAGAIDAFITMDPSAWKAHADGNN